MTTPTRNWAPFPEPTPKVPLDDIFSFDNSTHYQLYPHRYKSVPWNDLSTDIVMRVSGTVRSNDFQERPNVVEREEVVVSPK